MAPFNLTTFSVIIFRIFTERITALSIMMIQNSNILNNYIDITLSAHRQQITLSIMTVGILIISILTIY
jgi:hypothetical protein